MVKRKKENRDLTHSVQDPNLISNKDLDNKEEETALEAAKETLENVEINITKAKINPGSQVFLTRLNVALCPKCNQQALKDLRNELICPEDSSDCPYKT